jgi:poly-beta-1,6-N-acetyl-D-glucosamine synthase
MEKNKIRYIVISPVRNEEKNIEKTILSVISQTITPKKWVIVDDGSSDKTTDIVEKYTISNDWISLLHLPDRGYYDLMTGGEIKAFYRGYETIKDMDYDFIAKLDGDVSFDGHYFENLFQEFANNRRLGIASGAVYYDRNGELQLEKGYEKHVRGAGRVYRKECWQDIGGVINNLGWDVVDEYKARMLGWETFSFEKIKMIHYVKTFTKGGLYQGFMRSGRMEYLVGTHPLFFLIKVVGKIRIKPIMFGRLALLLGYLISFLKDENRVAEPKLVLYLRKEQLKRLFLMNETEHLP